MEQIPIEIVRIISLVLRPGFMVSVCKLYEQLYNESWYYDFLLMKCDRCEIIDRDFTFKELCKRYLAEGLVHILEESKTINLGVNAINVIPVEGDEYILKFNGDMVRRCVKINSNVIALDFDCYIKKTELYVLNRWNYVLIALVPELEIIDLQYIDTFRGLCRCQYYTFEAIYFNYYDEYDRGKIYKFIVNDGIIKAYTILQAMTKYITYILTNKNTLLIYFDKNFIAKPEIIYNVTDIGKNYICIKNQYFYYNKFDIKNLMFLGYTINSSILCSGFSNNYLSTDNTIIVINYNSHITKIIKYDFEIKKITGNSLTQYIILKN